MAGHGSAVSRRDIRRRAGRRAVLLVIVVGLLVAAGCSYQTTGVAPELPPVAQTSRVLAADGTLITTLRAEENRDLVRLVDIPSSLRNAVVAIEDDRFWLHHGIDIRGILRAAGSNASAGEITQGGSTITQQYVKNALLDPSQTVNRKLHEAVLAWRLEQTYSKETILEQYLNTIYFGHGAYGAAAAAEEYFGKPVGQLSLAESALLAGLIRAPSTSNPYDDPKVALDRRGVVLERMHELGYIDAATRDRADSEPLALAPEYEAGERYEAAHFVEAVKQWILSDPRFGATDEERRNLLFKGGLRITTTIDLTLQAAAERAVKERLPDAQDYPEGALVAVEPSSGRVKAMVGGRDFFGASKFAKYNLALGDGRQAGSTFKPIVLAAALENGVPLTRTYRAPATIDIPLGKGIAPWKVSNYGGSSAGTVSLTEATVWSYNTAYAQLMVDVGPAVAVDTAGRLGIQSPLAAVPAAVLGTENVTVLDMASAYATFANRGLHVEPVLVSRITRADGSLLYEAAPATYQAIQPDLADQLTWVLRQVIERGTGTAARLDRPAAGKTGTAEGYRDAWFVGYTPDLATAVWVGFAETQTPMVPPATPIQVTGGSWPADIWQAFMTAAHEGLTPRDFVQPERSALNRIESTRVTQRRADDTPATTSAPASSGNDRPAGPPGTATSTTTAERPPTTTTTSRKDKDAVTTTTTTTRSESTTTTSGDGAGSQDAAAVTASTGQSAPR